MRQKYMLRSVALVMAAGLVVAACGDDTKSTSSSSGSSSASLAAPAAIKSSGKLIFCSDISYPPEEFYDAKDATKAIGSDIEIGTDLAKRMGVTPEFDNTGFDGIIPALNAKKCDAIISGMNDTDERAKQVDFVDYISVGQSFMVKKGNPAGIKSLNDIAGKTVSVEVGTSNADFLASQSKTFEAAGKKPVTVTTFPADTDAANALRTGKVDAYFGDAPVVAYYIKTSPSDFEFGGTPVNPIKVGIAIRKGDELKSVVQKGIDAMYSDGTMAKILEKWEMSDSLLKK